MVTDPRTRRDEVLDGLVAMFLAVWHILLPGWRETPRGRDDVVP